MAGATYRYAHVTTSLARGETPGFDPRVAHPTLALRAFVWNRATHVAVRRGGGTGRAGTSA